MQEMHYIEVSLLEGIRQNDTDTLEYIYKKFYPSIRNFIILNSGCDADAKDIFQEIIIVVYRKLKKEQTRTISPIQITLNSRFIQLTDGSISNFKQNSFLVIILT